MVYKNKCAANFTFQEFLFMFQLTIHFSKFRSPTLFEVRKWYTFRNIMVSTPFLVAVQIVSDCRVVRCQLV